MRDSSLKLVSELTEVIKHLLSEDQPSNEASPTAYEDDSIYDYWIGKYVICRSRNDGVNSGKVLVLDDTGVVLEDARRLWSHRPNDASLSWYEGVAKSGLGPDYMISNEVKKIIVENYSLTECSTVAETNIRNAKTNEQREQDE